ncbi:MAG: hypothetical protein IAF58_01290 [Leptolyngbya sp.]|nr:hypothetical protein [Candidatus Melainabacteria bacterium]
MNDEPSLPDALWKLYQEHCTHVRHHEAQRSTVAATFLAIASALLGLVTFDKAIGLSDLPMTLLLTFIGGFGAIFSAKQYERASLHTERARHFRNAVDDLLDGKPLKRIKQEADAEHTKHFQRLARLRLNKFWLGLYALVAAIGLVLSVIAVLCPQKTP